MTVEGRLSALRIAARLANSFVLDLIKRLNVTLDVQDIVLLAAISQANVSHLGRDQDIQRRYASLDAPIDDGLLRPISVSGVADSLRMPFETARRRIARLARMGIVEGTARGVLIPSGPLASSIYSAAAQVNYDLVRALYDRLLRAGISPAALGPATGRAFTPNDPPIRLVARLSADCALRMLEPISAHMGDLVAGVVLMEVVHANTEDFPIDPGGDAMIELGAEGFPSDRLRKPVRIAEIARRLGLPTETARRKIHALLAKDRCERGPDGYIVPARVLAGEPLWTAMLDNRAQLLRLFANLGEMGVLALWRDENEGLRGAA